MESYLMLSKNVTYAWQAFRPTPSSHLGSNRSTDHLRNDLVWQQLSRRRLHAPSAIVRPIPHHFWFADGSPRSIAKTTKSLAGLTEHFHSYGFWPNRWWSLAIARQTESAVNLISSFILRKRWKAGQQIQLWTVSVVSPMKYLCVSLNSPINILTTPGRSTF